MRLDRILAQSGLGSRSEVQRLIRRGEISVDGKIVRDPGIHLTESQSETICLSGQPVRCRSHIHLMCYKPAGLITAMADARQETIRSLIPQVWISRGIAPVGRLDRDTTGLLLLTTDGVLNHRLTNPRWHVWKTYQVTYTGDPLLPETARQFKEGIRWSDDKILKPAFLTILDGGKAELSIQEGKFHQVKHMFQAVDRNVTLLHRIRIGPLQLDPDLSPGQCRELVEAEIKALYQQVDLPVLERDVNSGRLPEDRPGHGSNIQ